MATRSVTMGYRPRMNPQFRVHRQVPYRGPRQQCIDRLSNPRQFSSSAKLRQQNNSSKESFGSRLRKALKETKIKWYPIPVGVGIGFLGLAQLYRINEREKAKGDDGYTNFSASGENGVDGEQGGRPRRRERIRPSGPWLAKSLRCMHE